MSHRACLVLVMACILALAPRARAASQDQVVEQAGISHVPHLDRRPLCPTGGQPVEIRLRSRQGDLTGVRVRLHDGGAVSWTPAAVVGQTGPYDIWAATLSPPTSSSPRYSIEVADGNDIDYLGPDGFTLSPPVNEYTLDFATLSHAPLGATPLQGGGAVFKVWAPTRATVHVRGEFNGWGLGNPLTRAGDYFVGTVGTASPGQQYKYFFNNTVWNTDARARGLNPANNLNAFLEDPLGYTWTSAHAPTTDFESLVIYQLHVGTFAGHNDPAGSTPFPSRYVDVANRVSHLVDLGVNAVQLMPIQEFAGDESAGYNPITPWAPEWKYGSPDDLKNMIDVLHQNGIAVLVDIVWNHFSFTDNFLWNYDGSQIYYDDPPQSTPWGDQADFDDPEVRSFFLDSARLWLEEYRIDGFRMDATAFMDLGQHAASGYSLMQEFNDLIDVRYQDSFSIAEELPDDPAITRPTSAGGAGFDAQYHDRFTDDLRQEMIDSNGGTVDLWKLRDLVNGSGPELSGPRAYNYLELHDEVWPTSGGQRMVKTLDPSFPHDAAGAQDRIKLAQGFVLLAPGVPALHQGSEWLEDRNFGSGSGDRIDWSHKTTYAHIFRFFQDAIGLRRSLPALRAGAPHVLGHFNEFTDLMTFARADNAGNDLLIVAYFGRSLTLTDHRIGVPLAGDWVEILNSQAPLYGGSGVTNPGTIPADPLARDGFDHSLTLDLSPLTLIVLEHRPANIAAPDAARPEGALLQAVHPNPLRRSVTVGFRAEATTPVTLEIFDVRGRRIRTLVKGRVPGGVSEVPWRARDDRGRRVPAGIYLLRLTTPGHAETRRLVVLP